MVYRLCIAALAAAAAACTSLEPEYLRAATQPTPAAWSQPGAWRFELVSEDRYPRGSMAFDLTDELVPTCASGRWRRAIYRGGSATFPPLEDWYRDGDKYAAYMITGQVLVLQLNAPYCNQDVELRGIVSDEGAEGAFNWVGTISADFMGRFTAARAR